jgi:hypothetical protein
LPAFFFCAESIKSVRKKVGKKEWKVEIGRGLLSWWADRKSGLEDAEQPGEGTSEGGYTDNGAARAEPLNCAGV